MTEKWLKIFETLPKFNSIIFKSTLKNVAIVGFHLVPEGVCSYKFSSAVSKAEDGTSVYLLDNALLF